MFHPKNFEPQIFLGPKDIWYKKRLDQKSIGSQNCFWSNICHNKKGFLIKYFLIEFFYDRTILLIKNNFGQKKFRPQNFYGPKFLDPRFFNPNIFLTQRFLDINLFWTKKLEQKSLGSEIFLNQLFFNQTFFWIIYLGIKDYVASTLIIAKLIPAPA